MVRAEWVKLFALKNTVPVQLYRLKLVCILGRDEASFHRTCESLPGIVTPYGVNLLKPKVCNNLRLIASNFIKIKQGIDWTMFLNACEE